MKIKRIFTWMVVAALALTISACAGSEPSSEPPPVSENPIVYLRNTKFESEHVTIEAGDTVTWVWDDGDMMHDVSGDGFESEVMNEGEFSYTFEEAGTYAYVCTLHSGMKGSVTVVEASS